MSYEDDLARYYGYDLIRRNEGFDKKYRDGPQNNWGYGSKAPANVPMGSYPTRETAERDMRAEADKVFSTIQGVNPNLRPEIAASATSGGYNYGDDYFRRDGGGMNAALKSNDPQQWTAANNIKTGIGIGYMPGLAARRDRENAAASQPIPPPVTYDPFGTPYWSKIGMDEAGNIIPAGTNKGPAQQSAVVGSSGTVPSSSVTTPRPSTPPMGYGSQPMAEDQGALSRIFQNPMFQTGLGMLTTPGFDPVQGYGAAQNANLARLKGIDAQREMEIKKQREAEWNASMAPGGPMEGALKGYPPAALQALRLAGPDKGGEILSRFVTGKGDQDFQLGFLEKQQALARENKRLELQQSWDMLNNLGAEGQPGAQPAAPMGLPSGVSGISTGGAATRVGGAPAPSTGTPSLMPSVPMGLAPQAPPQPQAQPGQVPPLPPPQGPQGGALMPNNVPPAGAVPSGMQTNPNAPQINLPQLSPRALQLQKQAAFYGLQGNRAGVQAAEQELAKEPSFIMRQKESERLGVDAGKRAADQAAATQALGQFDDMQANAKAWFEHAPNAANGAIGKIQSGENYQTYVNSLPYVGNAGAQNFNTRLRHDADAIAVQLRKITGGGHSSDAADKTFKDAISKAIESNDPESFMAIMQSARNVIAKAGSLPDDYKLPDNGHGGKLRPEDVAAINKYATNPIAPGDPKIRTDQPVAAQTRQPVKVNSPEEAAALPKGTLFIGHDGQQRVRN